MKYAPDCHCEQSEARQRTDPFDELWRTISGYAPGLPRPPAGEAGLRQSAGLAMTNPPRCCKQSEVRQRARRTGLAMTGQK